VAIVLNQRTRLSAPVVLYDSFGSGSPSLKGLLLSNFLTSNSRPPSALRRVCR